MADVAGIVRYLRACYRSDSRHGAFANLDARSVEHLRWLPRDALLSGTLNWLPLPSADVAELAQAAALYRRERTLVYHAFPLIGRATGGPWAGQRLFAPLFVFPAELSAFARELMSKLEERGYRTWPDHLVAGMEVDLLVEKDGRSLGVDLIGQAGASGAAFDLGRCRMLRRAGLPVFPLPLAAWREDPARCLNALEAVRDRGHNT